jgi:hypothetical protein
MTVILPKAKDNATGRLNAGISAATLSIPLQSGQGANFPQPYTGTASSIGSRTVLNDTGDLGSLVAGDFIRNVTDGSWALVVTAGASSITTTRLQGGSDNTWDNGDTWRSGEFVLTLAAINAAGTDTAYEEVLISNRSTDTLTVPSGGRGYNSTTAQSFLAGDYVQLRVTAPYHEELRKLLKEFKQDTDSSATTLAALITDLLSTANAKGASMVGIEDAGLNYTGVTVEAALTEIDTRLDATITLSQMGFYGDGSDGVPVWTSGASLDPTSEKRYTTATLPVSQTLTVSSVNTPLIIHSSSNVVINGTVDLNGKGGAGGAAQANNTSGVAGTAGKSVIAAITAAAGSGGTTVSNNGGGGGSGASFTAAGGAGENNTNGQGGAGGALMSSGNAAMLASLKRGVCCGGGSGSGGGGTGVAGGAGGAGGGALVWVIGGNLTLGAASIIRADGATGGNGTGAGAGGGGGGAGGAILIIVAGTITNSGVTLSAAGGAQGSDTGGGTDSDGATGAAGRAIIYSLSTGTLITA